jgi:hypothetical protein
MPKSLAKTAPDQLSIDLWSCEAGDIRVTSVGQPSVFDMIRVLGGQKNPRDTWANLVEKYPEVVGKCDNLKFPGRGQRETPVARTKEDAYYILGLLPGTVGRKYREDAAKLFTAFLDDPLSVAKSAADVLTPEQSEWLEARLNSKRTRNLTTEDYKKCGVEGVGFAMCTNAIYQPILGATASQLKTKISEKKELPIKSINPRDHMSIKELNDVEFAERVAAGQVKRANAYGNKQVVSVVRHSAEYTKKLLDGDISIPGL